MSDTLSWYSLYLALAAWGLFALVQVVLFLLGAWLTAPAGPSFNGFRVRVPLEHVAQLSGRELTAVVMHELGHRARHHVWKNLARACCALPMTAERRTRQELEADDYVTDPLALASALRKMSQHPLDLLRATRLEAKVQQHLAGGTPVDTTQGSN